MKKNVWIFNHYATNMYFDEGGRHYWFSEKLLEKGYNPTIFCSSINHSSENHIETYKKRYSTKIKNDIPFVFVKTTKYKGNGRSRILNMFSFYRRLFPTTKKMVQKYEKPDVIIASSVHPLTLVAGIKIARKLNIPCICEIRDLWPESIVAYGFLKRSSIIAKLLYQGEKWIYKKANSIIMTWEGGRQYIEDSGWDKQIDLNKIKHISNGIIIDSFDKNSQENNIDDLDDKKYKNITYAGSIRKVNNLGLLLDTAKIILKNDKKIRFLIYGSGGEKEMLEKRCKEEDIDNVIFKGRVEKKMIPAILKKSYANILHNSSTSLDKYGQSQNKLFEYLAAGRPIIQTYSVGYSIINEYECGVCVKEQNPKEIAESILSICGNEVLLNRMSENARKASYEFDFDVLTNKLVEVIENTERENGK